MLLTRDLERSEHSQRQFDQVECVASIISDLDQSSVCAGLDHGGLRPRFPTARGNLELDHVKRMSGRDF